MMSSRRKRGLAALVVYCLIKKRNKKVEKKMCVYLKISVFDIFIYNRYTCIVFYIELFFSFSDTDHEGKANKELKSVAEEDALRKLLTSDEDSEEEKNKSGEESNKDEENADKDAKDKDNKEKKDVKDKKKNPKKRKKDDKKGKYKFSSIFIKLKCMLLISLDEPFIAYVF